MDKRYGPRIKLPTLTCIECGDTHPGEEFCACCTSTCHRCCPYPLPQTPPEFTADEWAAHMLSSAWGRRVRDGKSNLRHRNALKLNKMAEMIEKITDL